MGLQIFDNYGYGKTVRILCDKCGRKNYRKIEDADAFLKEEQNRLEGWQILLEPDGNLKTLCPNCKQEEIRLNDQPVSIFNLLGWEETRPNITCTKLKILADRDKAMEPDVCELGVVCPVCFHETHKPPSVGKCFCSCCGQRLKWKEEYKMDEPKKFNQDKEAEPMAVLVMPWPKRGCRECDICLEIDENRNMVHCGYEGVFRPMTDGMYSFCHLRKVIGIIEPNGHVADLREEEK